MSFLNLGVTPFLLGLAVLAGLLFFLQRLQVKFSETEVVTALFWKQAVEETRARVLVRRFRHPLAYLLALAIASMIWLAFAEPDRNRDDDKETIFLLDGSAGMSWGDRFQQARELLLKEAGRIPAAQRRVYFCGADTRLILDRGEETRLLRPRLAGLVPETCPSSMERALFALSTDDTTAREMKLMVVGDALVRDDALSLFSDHAIIERLRSEKTPRLENSIGIAAIGVADAASGAFDRVDVMIEIAGDSGTGIIISLGGQPLNQAPVKDGQTYVLSDLPARGEVLEVVLVEEDALAVDNRARITLPTKHTVAVAVDENLDARFRVLVEADPALVPAGSDAPARVVVGGAADGSLPAIELVTGHDVTIIYENGLSLLELEQIRARFFQTGLDRVGRKLKPGPEQAGRVELAPRYVPGPTRKVQVGIELIGDDYDFLQSSAFPVFLSSAIRWLAGVEPIEPFAVAGERSIRAGHFTLAGSEYAPPRAGPHLDCDGKTFEVSLPALELPKSRVLKEVTRSTTGTGPWPGVATWCILLALLLIGAEWWLFQKGRIP